VEKCDWTSAALESEYERRQMTEMYDAGRQLKVTGQWLICD